MWQMEHTAGQSRPLPRGVLVAAQFQLWMLLRGCSGELCQIHLRFKRRSLSR